LKEITSRRQLQQLAKDLKMRTDWHEPDEQGISVGIEGKKFDNAGLLGEINIYLIQDDERLIAKVNLATLFAFACGTYEGEEL